MSTQPTQSDQANTTTITKIGDNEYTQRDLNDLLFAFAIHGIQENTGINFHQFASFKDDVQIAIMNSSINLDSKRKYIDNSRSNIGGSNHQESPAIDMGMYQQFVDAGDRSAMFASQVPPWMKTNPPPWANNTSSPIYNQRPIFNLQELHKALNLIITVLPQFSQDILSTRFEFQGSYITVTDALYYLYGGIQQFHPQVTNSRKF